MTDVELGPGREFDLIRELRRRWGDLAVGLGDDAATLAVPRGDQLVLSTDAAVEHVHFEREWLTLEEIGYRAVTAALSDLAAMAADPLGVLVSLQLPRQDATEAAALADGIGDAVRSAGTVIRGGNVSAGSELAITTTVLGAAYTPLRRSGARAGDRLYLTGALGGPRAALRALREGRKPPAECRARFARPRARLAEATWLAARGAVAGIDVSDGLAGDCAHLAAASGILVSVELERVPVVAGADPADVFGGEEYELLVAARSPLPVDEFQAAFGIPLTAVGAVAAGAAEARFTRAGRRVDPPAGHDHLSRG